LEKETDLSFPVLSRKCLPEKQKGKLLVWLLVILDTVQGIRLDFLTTPVQSYLPNPYFHKKADQDMIDAEVMNLVQKNAV
jgi:hypothetical protein